MTDPICARTPSLELSRRDALAGGVFLAVGASLPVSIPLRDDRFVVVAGWVLTRDDVSRLAASPTG